LLPLCRAYTCHAAQRPQFPLDAVSHYPSDFWLFNARTPFRVPQLLVLWRKDEEGVGRHNGSMGVESGGWLRDVGLRSGAQDGSRACRQVSVDSSFNIRI
jgi:hypothetical protein